MLSSGRGISSGARSPAVAGSFYSSNPVRLRKEVESLLAGAPDLREIPIAALVPHAGYVYSGHTAARFYGGVQIADRIVLIGPNHTGYGRLASLDPADSWLTPLGPVEVDRPFRDFLLSLSKQLELDSVAHFREHSLEVQLPFLQVVKPGARIVPVILGRLALRDAVELGRELAAAIRESEGSTMILASSDMNHYESQEVTIEKDEIALDRFLALDAEGLFQDVERSGISMCGVIPATVALVAARELGAARGLLLEHRTSGEAFGDYEQVVGYASSVVC